MEIGRVPAALALIPDGNRRWARGHGLSIFNGYSKGVTKFLEFGEWCKEYGINNITIWALSSDNLSRPKEEVNALFSIYKKVAKDRKIIDMLHRNQTRISVISDKRILPSDLASSLHRLETETSIYKERVINLLMGYGGREDILHAAKKAAASVAAGKRVRFEEVFQRSLLSNNIPNLDLVIRTSGEMRLSGFMPWQSGYSELYFSNKLWPDFTRSDLEAALLDYSSRDRRFGK